jgi:hypothetical protein
MAEEYEEEFYQDGNDALGGLGALAALMGSFNQTTPEAQDIARGIMDRQLEGDPFASEQGFMSDLEAQAEQTRQAIRDARAKLAAKKYSKARMWLAASEGLGAPTKSGAFSESMSNLAGRLNPEITARDEFNINRDAELLKYDTSLIGIDEGLTKTRMKLAEMKRRQDAELAKEALKILGKPTSSGNKVAQIPIRAREAVDREFAKDYVEFIQTGASDAAKALEELGGARDQLRGYYINEEGERVPVKGGKRDDLTGAFVGTVAGIPGVGKVAQDIFFPESSDVQETVEYTVQRSLRPILGSQFTKEEGERLISRVYNPRLKEEVNASRLDRLIKQLDRAHQEKRRAAAYFEQWGTLTGFRGRTAWTVDDFMPNAPAPTDFKDGGGEEEDFDNEHTPDVDEGAPPRKKVPGRVKFSDLSPEQQKAVLEQLQKGRKGYAEGGAVDSTMERLRSLMQRMNLGTDEKLSQLQSRVAAPPTEVEMPDGTIVELDTPPPAEEEGVTIPEDAVRGGSAAALYLAGEQAAKRLGMSPAMIRLMPKSELIRLALVGGTTAGFFEGVQGKDPSLTSELEAAAYGTGAGTLGALAAKYGLRGAEAISDRIPGRRITPAEQKVLQALEEEGQTPQGVANRTRSARRAGVPAMAIDEGGRGARALGELAMGAGRKESGELLDTMEERQSGSRERVSERVNQSLKPDEYFSKLDELNKELYSNAGPLYKKAYEAFPSLNSKELFQLMNTPTGKKAVKAATQAIRDVPGATIGPRDAMGMVQKPSLEFLDQVKQELDDMIKREEATAPTGQGKRWRSLRNALRDELDKLTTDPKTGESLYKTARATYAGDLEVRARRAASSRLEHVLRREGRAALGRRPEAVPDAGSALVGHQRGSSNRRFTGRSETTRSGLR